MLRDPAEPIGCVLCVLEHPGDRDRLSGLHGTAAQFGFQRTSAGVQSGARAVDRSRRGRILVLAAVETKAPGLTILVRGTDGLMAQRRLFLFTLALALGFAAHLARAQSCYENCQSSCKDLSGHLNPGCVDNCNRAYCETRVQNQPRPFGAIAYGTDHGAEGISWNKGTQAEADQAALASCNQNGNNCRIVYRYRETCAALAVAKGGMHVESATGPTEKSAAAQATELCRQNWGVCLSDLSACSLTGSRLPPPPPPPSTRGGASWGAIAYSTAEMAAGTASGKADRAAAENEAMTVCAQRGRGCVLQLAFNRGCAALAADRNFAGSGTSEDQRAAQQKAIDECRKAGGARCVLHISFCSN